MSELRENLSAYLDAAERGVAITITRRGKPSATLAAARIPEAIDAEALGRFRDSLGIRAERSAILELRKSERY